MKHHPEYHKNDRIAWLRAAVLGANDGIISTASLMMGVAAADTTHSSIILAGLAGLVAGAMSMAAGEYVSVSTQADTEQAELKRENAELIAYPERELLELAHIYQKRGLEKALALEVATRLTAHDALDAHARDELGIMNHTKAKPLQAAITSAATFTVGATLPLLTAFIFPADLSIAVGFITLISLALLGIISARLGATPITKAVARIMFWGISAMLVTIAIGALFGVAA